jgi:tRNA threonylcarbamoyladenosine biosynthesis protein TsaB
MTMALSVAQRILAFDTSTTRGSVSLLEGQEVRAELRLQSLQTHSTLLLSSIHFLLDRLDWTLGDLNLVAVGTGPGSFTGIRIGVATALGISQSMSIPYIGISGLDALASQAASQCEKIGVVLDAHRSQVYYAEYVSNGRKIRQSQKSMLMDISALERHLVDRHLYIAGDTNACNFKESKRSSTRWPRILSTDLFLAASIGRLALNKKKQWRSGTYIVSEPTYIRPPDALGNKSRKR